MYHNFQRVPSRPVAMRADKLETKAFPAPTGGWMSAVNLAAVKPGYAKVLENWFPTTTGIKLRAGSALWGTAKATNDSPVESFITYIAGSTRQLFAGCNGSIFPMTSPASPTTVPTAAVTGQTSNYYSSANFQTAGGNFITVCNGSDPVLLYNGTTWAQQTGSGGNAITGVTTSTLSHVWISQQRMWFVQKNTMLAWFLPVNSIAGAAQSVNLAGVFQRGGSLVLGATWAVNTGGGLVQTTVFVSSEGEYAIYSGSDPTSATTWNLVGVYYGSPPLGRNQNAFMQAGADLLVLTYAGIVSLTNIQLKDAAALSISAITAKIQPDWQAEQAARRSIPWEIVKWPSRNYAIVNCPVTNSNNLPICFVVNLETGAWCKYTGWDSRCLALHNDSLYFGTNTGTIVQGETTGADQGALIKHLFVGHADHLGAIGYNKTTRQSQAVFRTLVAFTPKLSIATNYVENIPSWPSAAAASTTSGIWDTGLWDTAKWDVGASYYNVSTKWVTTPSTGYAHAPVIQVASGSATPPSAELVVIQVTYERGGLVV
jgi:hypothetical protein